MCKLYNYMCADICRNVFNDIKTYHVLSVDAIVDSFIRDFVPAVGIAFILGRLSRIINSTCMTLPRAGLHTKQSA